MNTINLAVDEALLLEAYKVGQHRSLTDTIMAALQAYINDPKPRPILNGVDNIIEERINDSEPEPDRPKPNSIYEVHKYAIDTGIEDMALNVDHYLYGLDKRDE